MNKRFLFTAGPLAGLVIAAAAACGPSGASTGASASSAAARVSAEASSTQVQAARASALALIGPCQPKGSSVTAWEVSWALHPVKTATAFMTCEKIPASQEQPLVICIVGAAKTARAAAGDKAAKEAAFVNDAAACTRLAQGATPSPSASAS